LPWECDDEEAVRSAARGSERSYSVREVADRLGVHPETVRRLVHAGRLEAVREGRALRLTESSVHALLEQQRQKPSRD
jgi:excisionase family DNA binding protein